MWVFGIYAILDGIAAVALGIRTRGEPHWVWTIVQGVVSVLAGLIALVWPGVTALALLFLIAVWAIILGGRGDRRRVRSPQGRVDRVGPGRWPPASLNVVFGVLLLIWPASGILTLVWLVGIFMIAGGIGLIILAFRVRPVARLTDNALGVR